MAGSIRRLTWGDPEREATARAALFRPEGGAEEIHLCLMPPPDGSPFAHQLDALERRYRQALAELDLPEATTVLRRFFLSDTANQERSLRASPLGRPTPENPFALSVVEQPPLPAGRLALWAWHLRDGGSNTIKEARPGGVLVRRPGDRHLLTTDLHGQGEPGATDPAGQTREGFDALGRVLAAEGANLRDQVIRTWIFVQGVDIHYGDMVQERVDLFREQGLTETSHYIASTGIEGRRGDPRRLVLLEAYTLPDITPERIRFLTAPQQLGPTHAYGVTFERGVRTAYGDRHHLLISGTASIDNRGEILHPGDILGQTRRTLANIEGLLADGGGGFEDLAQMIVYLRDPADHLAVTDHLARTLPDVPYVLVRAPVCRPGWLIEIECWALTAGGEPGLAPF